MFMNQFGEVILVPMQLLKSFKNMEMETAPSAASSGILLSDDGMAKTEITGEGAGSQSFYCHTDMSLPTPKRGSSQRYA